mmetsp:Transcript_27398/g.61883  ORF Transcript_27398/g.61883 Transcript_27398/m.61883 type:complete len:254 (+) Transcript_27398:56-817(+)
MHHFHTFAVFAGFIFISNAFLTAKRGTRYERSSLIVEQECLSSGYPSFLRQKKRNGYLWLKSECDSNQEGGPQQECGEDTSIKSTFVLERNNPEPTEAELSNENLVKNVLQENTDEEVNFLVWKCLGYRYNPETEEWTNEDVFPKWREKYPSPPDLIGVTRTYSKEVDQPVMKANQQLVRSIPMPYKQILKQEMKKVGWKGYKMEGLTPNKTRRAQVTNWLLFYREKLWGVPLEELIRRKEEENQEGVRSDQY